MANYGRRSGMKNVLSEVLRTLRSMGQHASPHCRGHGILPKLYETRKRSHQWLSRLALAPVLEMSFRHQPNGVFVHATDLRHLMRTPRTLIRSLLITWPVGDNFDEQHLHAALRTIRTSRMCVHLSLWDRRPSLSPLEDRNESGRRFPY